jgi:CII-binding regulator of phage lambda lysogenization HflD
MSNSYAMIEQQSDTEWKFGKKNISKSSKAKQKFITMILFIHSFIQSAHEAVDELFRRVSYFAAALQYFSNHEEHHEMLSQKEEPT